VAAFAILALLIMFAQNRLTKDITIVSKEPRNLAPIRNAPTGSYAVEPINVDLKEALKRIIINHVAEILIGFFIIIFLVWLI